MQARDRACAQGTGSCPGTYISLPPCRLVSRRVCRPPPRNRDVLRTAARLLLPTWSNADTSRKAVSYSALTLFYFFALCHQKRSTKHDFHVSLHSSWHVYEIIIIIKKKKLTQPRKGATDTTLHPNCATRFARSNTRKKKVTIKLKMWLYTEWKYRWSTDNVWQ